MAEPIKITVSSVLEDLKNGYTRTTGEKYYLGEGKSIQEKYTLNKSQVKDLFDHPKLKGKKTIAVKAPAFILIDDEEEAEVEINHEPQESDNTDITDSNDGNVQEVEAEEVPSSEESPEWMN